MAEIHDSFVVGEQEAKEILDFDALVDEADEERRRKVRHAADNPFLCSDGKLRDLYLQSVADKPLAGRKKAKERATGAKSSGRREFVPMGGGD